MSDRPSQHPTGRLRPVEIPKAPRAPRLDGESVAREPAAVGPSHEGPPPSAPTSPPPAAFTELRQMSRHPSPPPPSVREEPRHLDSRSFTLPGPHAVPRLAVDPADLSWFEINEETRGLVAFVDGQRTITRIALEGGIAPREAQLRIADLRARGIVELE